MKKEDIGPNVSYTGTYSNLGQTENNKDVLKVEEKQETIKIDSAESKAYFSFEDCHNETNSVISGFSENNFHYDTLHKIEVANSVSESLKQTNSFS